jgi:hypothetical protein
MLVRVFLSVRRAQFIYLSNPTTLTELQQIKTINGSALNICTKEVVLKVRNNIMYPIYGSDNYAYHLF